MSLHSLGKIDLGESDLLQKYFGKMDLGKNDYIPLTLAILWYANGQGIPFGIYSVLLLITSNFERSLMYLRIITILPLVRDTYSYESLCVCLYLGFNSGPMCSQASVLPIF